MYSYGALPPWGLPPDVRVLPGGHFSRPLTEQEADPLSWCNRARTKLAAMDALIAQGRGDTRVAGGGCTEPGGGIVPTTHTAREMAAMLRQQVARCGAGTLAQAPQCWYPQGETPNAPGSTCYLLNESKQLSKGGVYSFFIAIPSTMQDCCGAGSAADLLTQQGWNIAGFSSPPAGYAQALQVLTSQNLPAPAVWQVNATWNGPDGVVLPGHIGSTATDAIYFGPIFTGYAFSGPPAPKQPIVEPPVNQPAWPAIVGLLAGVTIIGSAWWYVRKAAHSQAAFGYENPRVTGAHDGPHSIDQSPDYRADMHWIQHQAAQRSLGGGTPGPLQTLVGGRFLVSTAHDFSYGYETVVFDQAGKRKGPAQLGTAVDRDLYDSEVEARAGHLKMIEKWSTKPWYRRASTHGSGVSGYENPIEYRKRPNLRALRARRSPQKQEELERAVTSFFTNTVALPNAPQGLVLRSIWWEKRGGWKYPWRITSYVNGVAQGYPCGEPERIR